MGYFLAFLSAVLEAAKVATAKKGLVVADEYFLSWIMRLIGLAGVILVVSGSYFLQKNKTGLIWWRHPGVRLMLLVTFIWSLEANVHKVGISQSSAAFWTVAQFVGVSLILGGYNLSRKQLTVIFGWLFFKETEIRRRLLAAGVMIVGVLLISFWG